ncbi:MAG: substrate-binding domain-containing protein [Chloroflexota bacterium]|nr:substrate-binding domain-containing protein [Chloroflexota bacterium]
MDTIQEIDSFEIAKMLSDARRLAIIRLLMVVPATLTQLGKSLDMHPAQVRYHLKKLEGVELVELVSRRVVRGFVEKYYQATARAYRINLTIVPQNPHRETVIASGSHDLALELLAQSMCRDETTPDMFALPIGSLDGLIALRQGMCQIAGCHLLDPQSGEYNLSYVRHIFPGQDMRLVTLARRQQGLLVKSGNPLGISSLEDLARPGVHFVNRKRGSGTRLWLDQQLLEQGIPSDQIQGYDWTVNTHLQVAEAVATSQADVGLAVVAAAQKSNLDFVPLFEERYDLVIPAEHYQSSLLAAPLDHIHTAAFRQAVEGLGGYNPKEAGTEMKVN